MLDLTKPIETVPCARNPEAVPCEVVGNHHVSILSLWNAGPSYGRVMGVWEFNPGTGRFLYLDGAVRNVVAREEPADDWGPKTTVDGVRPAIRLRADPPKTLRDEFAMAALTGLLAGVGLDTIVSVGGLAHSFALGAHEIADAMMAERRFGGEA